MKRNVGQKSSSWKLQNNFPLWNCSIKLINMGDTATSSLSEIFQQQHVHFYRFSFRWWYSTASSFYVWFYSQIAKRINSFCNMEMGLTSEAYLFHFIYWCWRLRLSDFWFGSRMWFSELFFIVVWHLQPRWTSKMFKFYVFHYKANWENVAS